MSRKIVLDTHILIWSLIAPDNLKEQTKTIIDEALSANNLFISSISLWEIAMLVHKKRINVYERLEDFLSSITNIKGLNTIEISPTIAAESVMLPGGFYTDPADCIIIASTREIAATLITRDQKILDWAEMGYLRVELG